MCTECVEEKRDLVRSIPKNRKLSDLPKIHQVHLSISRCLAFSVVCIYLIRNNWPISITLYAAAYFDNLGRI